MFGGEKSATPYNSSFFVSQLKRVCLGRDPDAVLGSDFQKLHLRFFVSSCEWQGEDEEGFLLAGHPHPQLISQCSRAWFSPFLCLLNSSKCHKDGMVTLNDWILSCWGFRSGRLSKGKRQTSSYMESFRQDFLNAECYGYFGRGFYSVTFQLEIFLTFSNMVCMCNIYSSVL